MPDLTIPIKKRSDDERRLLLVTGMPRTGTTAIGNILSLGPNSSSLHEPFNFHVGIPGITSFFEFIDSTELDREKLDRYVESIRNLKLHFRKGAFPREKGLRKFFKNFTGGRVRHSYRICKLTPFLRVIVWKDPFACLIPGYLARRHNVDILVTIRSPWATAASFKRMGWGFDLQKIIDADLPWKMDIPAADHVPDKSEYVLNAAVLWNLIYGNIKEWSLKNPSIRIVNIDKVIQNPIETCNEIYSEMEFHWNARIEKKILKIYSNRKGSEEPRYRKAHDSKRNIQSINTYWSKILTEEEKNIVTETCGSLWEKLKDFPLVPFNNYSSDIDTGKYANYSAINHS